MDPNIEPLGLYPRVYDELHAIARRELRRFRPGHTLNTTALIHEAYLKLADREEPASYERTHFLAVAALAMRQIIVDYARSRRAQKRGGGAVHAPLDVLHEGPAHLRVDAQAEAIVALDDALKALAALDERLVRVVELRFFGGLSVEETAEVLDVSPATVKRDTRTARAFVTRHMEG